VRVRSTFQETFLLKMRQPLSQSVSKFDVALIATVAVKALLMHCWSFNSHVH